MENEILSKLEAQDQKLEAIFKSAEKTRRYFQVIFWVTIVTVLLPLLGLIIGIPMFINSYTSQFEGLL
ncbi:MAG: hypothetical protein RLZZ76_238 [Candidatus Parcubacteria bacterium]|jgi:CHASE3 domain sensor protein